MLQSGRSGYSLVVEHVLAKDEMGVRFSLSALKFRKLHLLGKMR